MDGELASSSLRKVTIKVVYFKVEWSMGINSNETSSVVNGCSVNSEAWILPYLEMLHQNSNQECKI